MNIRITSDILSHAEKLDLSFFEDPAKRDLLDRAQQNPADPFMAFVVELQNTVDEPLTNAFFGRPLGGDRTPGSFSPGSLCPPVSCLSLAPFKETLPRKNIAARRNDVGRVISYLF